MLTKPRSTPATTPVAIDDTPATPGVDNCSQSDIALMSDAISDQLQFAAHRGLGLTPRILTLMATLKRARTIGDVPFERDALPRTILGYLQASLEGPLKVFIPPTNLNEMKLNPICVPSPRYPAPRPR